VSSLRVSDVIHGPVDALDAKIVRVLQQEGRISVVELADRIGLSPTPTQRRLQRLEREGIIAGYAARLDRRRAGLSLTVFLHLKVEGHHERNAALLQKQLPSMPEVVSCHIVSGDADLIAEVVVPDLAAYEAFLMGKLLKLGVIKEVRSSISLRALKIDGPLNVPAKQ
jgi:Lrp/AsnC family leucine-responsive transcriptional regulator